jgi:hypothetical protein
MFEATFGYLDLIANNLVEEACDTSAAGQEFWKNRKNVK